MIMDITSVSTKGQVVIPLAMRDQLGLTSGSKLAVFCDGRRLLLKPITPPQAKSFSALITQSEAALRKASKSRRQGAK